MYIINDYQLVALGSEYLINNGNRGAKISNKKLADILIHLQNQPQLEINEEQLEALAAKYEVNLEQLKSTLITQLKILKPLLSRKFPMLTINVDNDLIADLLTQSFRREYNLNIVSDANHVYPRQSLVIFFRTNYTNPDFKKLYQSLTEDVYVITAGVIHKLLIIDNFYFVGSGLPTHISNLHQLMTYLNTDVPATKNNWLLYYRNIVKNNIDVFPDPTIHACQLGYIAFCLHQFASQFTNLWETPTPLDQLNWFWHADLTSFSVHREVATHSPFSEYDMKLDLAHLSYQETA